MRTLSILLAACGLLSAQGCRLTLDDLVSVEAIGETVLSPDGKTFAMTRNAQIVLMPADGGWLITLTSTTGGKAGLSWSPDGRTIAFASQGGIWVVPVTGGSPRRLTNAAAGGGDPRSASDRAPQYSAKGKWILFETGRRGRDSLMVVSDDGMVNAYLSQSSADEEAASWSPYSRGAPRTIPRPTRPKPTGGRTTMRSAHAKQITGFVISRQDGSSI